MVKLIIWGVILPVAGSIISIKWFSDIHIHHESIHLVFELTGALIVLFIVPLLLRLDSSLHIKHYQYKFWVASALLGMGILDGFHAFSPLGNNFVWLHSIATFVGGVLFMGVLIPFSVLRVNKWLPFTVCILSSAIGVFSFIYKDNIPVMVVDGEFTLLAQLLNIIGGMCFCIACIYFCKFFIKKKDQAFYFLAAHCLLFGVAGILFELSSLWDLAWWWWHLLRLIAYIVLIFFYLSDVQSDKPIVVAASANHNKQMNSYIYGLSLVVCFMAIIVMYGWYTNNRILIQVLPHLAPMQFNTALGFLMGGIGCFCLLRKPKYALLLGGGLVVLSSATLMQYILGTQYGIDTLFMNADIHTRVTHIGRMAPSTALCFTLVGIALLFCRYLVVVISMTGSVFCLVFITILGYVIGFEGISVLESVTRMAVHTTIGFLLLSICLFIFYQIKATKKRIDIWQLSPFIIFVVIFSITIFVWHSMKEVYEEQDQHNVEELVMERVSAVKKRFALYEQALLGGVGFIKGSNNVSRDEWRAYVKALNIQEYLPGTNGIGFIDKVVAPDMEEYITQVRNDGMPDFTNHPQTDYYDKFIIKYIEPENINQPALGLDIGFEIHRREAAMLAVDTGEIALTKKIYLVQDEDKMAGFLLLAPVYEADIYLSSVKERRESFKGWVYSPFMARKFMADLENKDQSPIAFTVYDGEHVADEAMIYQSYNMNMVDQRIANDYTITTSMHLAQRTWTIVWTPTQFFHFKSKSEFLSVLLIVGILFAILVSGLFYFMSQLYGSSTKQVAENQKRLSNIFKTAVDGIITMNSRGDISSFNPACEKMFGYSASEVIGKNIHLLLPFVRINNKDEKQLYIYDYIKNKKKKMINISEETEAKRKNGTVFSIEISVSKAVVNYTYLFTIIIRDISERKQVEVMKNEFISTVNHELRTPLTSIYVSLGLLKKDMENSLNETGKRVLELAHNNCERLSSLVNDILDAEKIAAGKMEYAIQKHEMCGLVKRIIEQNQSYASKQGVTFVFESNIESIFCKIDSDRFTQALVNLLSNAAKFSPEGEEVVIAITTKEKQKKICIAVKDKGPGIPESFYDKVFTRFAQADSSSTRKKGGTGLGLNITKSIIEMFKGTVTFTSKEGVGTTFIFTLPVCSPPTKKELL